MLFNLVNFPYWILLGIGVGLFLLVITSGIGDDDPDVDTDVEGDLDVDVNAGAEAPDLDTELEADAETEREWTPKSLGFRILGWLGLGRAPLMLLLAIDFSAWGFLGWMFNVGVYSLLGPLIGRFLEAGVLLSSLILALMIGGWVSRPLGLVFAGFGEDASEERLIGRVGRVSSHQICGDGRLGQVDVIDAANNLITISAMLPEWATEAPKRGEDVLIIACDPKAYLVIRKDGADQSKWFTNQT
jgi:hypothetical protein